MMAPGCVRWEGGRGSTASCSFHALGDRSFGAVRVVHDPSFVALRTRAASAAGGVSDSRGTFVVRRVEIVIDSSSNIKK